MASSGFTPPEQQPILESPPTDYQSTQMTYEERKEDEAADGENKDEISLHIDPYIPEKAVTRSTNPFDDNYDTSPSTHLFSNPFLQPENNYEDNTSLQAHDQENGLVTNGLSVGFQFDEDFWEFKQKEINKKLRAGQVLTKSEKIFIAELLKKQGYPEDQLEEEVFNYMGPLYREFYGCPYIMYFLLNVGALLLEITYAGYTMKVAKGGIESFCANILHKTIDPTLAQGLGVFLGAGAFIPDLTTFDVFTMTNVLIVQYAERKSLRSKISELSAHFYAKPDKYQLIHVSSKEALDVSMVEGQAVVIVNGPQEVEHDIYFVKDKQFVQAPTQTSKPDEFVSVLSYLTNEEKQYIRLKKQQEHQPDLLKVRVNLSLQEQAMLEDNNFGVIEKTPDKIILINRIIKEAIVNADLVDPAKTISLATLGTMVLGILLVHNLTGAYADILGVTIPNTILGVTLKAFMLVLGNNYYDNFLTPKVWSGLEKHGIYPFNISTFKKNSLTLKFLSGDFARATNVAFQIASTTLLRAISFGFLVPLIQADFFGLWFPRTVVYPMVIAHTLLSRFYATYDRYYKKGEQVHALVREFPELIDMYIRENMGISLADLTKLEDTTYLQTILDKMAKDLRKHRSCGKTLCAEIPAIVLAVPRTFQMAMFIGAIMAYLEPESVIPILSFYILGAVGALAHYQFAESRRVDDGVVLEYLEAQKPLLREELQTRAQLLQEKTDFLVTQAKELQQLLLRQASTAPTAVEALSLQLQREIRTNKDQITLLRNRAELLPRPSVKVETVAQVSRGSAWKERLRYGFVAITTGINNFARSISAANFAASEGTAAGISPSTSVPGATLLATETGVNGFFTMFPNTLGTSKVIVNNTTRLMKTLWCGKRDHDVENPEPSFNIQLDEAEPDHGNQGQMGRSLTPQKKSTGLALQYRHPGFNLSAVHIRSSANKADRYPDLLSTSKATLFDSAKREQMILEMQESWLNKNDGDNTTLRIPSPLVAREAGGRL